MDLISTITKPIDPLNHGAWIFLDKDVKLTSNNEWKCDI